MVMLPSSKYREVLGRSDEYNDEISGWSYEEWCGIKMGTPEAPITVDNEPPNESWSNVISPKPTTSTETDYEKLYEVILQTFESIGLTWKVESRLAEFGKVIRVSIPSSLIGDASKGVVKALLKGREKMINRAKSSKSMTRGEKKAMIERANQIGYAAIVEELRELTPPTPVFEVAN